MFITRKFVATGVNSLGQKIGYAKNMVDVESIVPVKLAMNKNFQKFMTSFSNVVRELQSLKKRSYLKSLLIVELKQQLKSLRKFEGKMYEYRYIHQFNKIHKHVPLNVIMNDSVILSHITKEYNLYKSEKKELTPKEAEFYYLSRYDRRCHLQEWNQFKSKQETGFKIRVRKMVGTLDYSKSMVSYFSYVNLKQFDTETKMVTTRGQKADTTYSWSDGYHRGGWRFGGISSDCLKTFAKENGMDVKNKKYGDYAHYMLKL